MEKLNYQVLRKSGYEGFREISIFKDGLML